MFNVNDLVPTNVKEIYLCILLFIQSQGFPCLAFSASLVYHQHISCNYLYVPSFNSKTTFLWSILRSCFCACPQFGSNKLISFSIGLDILALTLFFFIFKPHLIFSCHRTLARLIPRYEYPFFFVSKYFLNCHIFREVFLTPPYKKDFSLQFHSAMCISSFKLIIV